MCGSIIWTEPSNPPQPMIMGVPPCPMAMGIR
jgi:hypothetical protein